MTVVSAGVDPDLVMMNTGGDRKPGLHLSDITKRMAFERDKKLNPDSPIDAMVLERGFTWEAALEHALASRHKRPGHRPEQLQEDGIWMSPDWVNPGGDIQVEEWKATKKSMKRGFDDVSWHWMPNTMAYVRALLRRKLATTPAVRFRIWWINGDYSFESRNSDLHLFNEYWKVDVLFTYRELEENWQAILNNGRRFGLLKEAPCPSPTSRATTAEKRSSKAPPPSRKTARLVTFPSGPKASRRNSAS